jgi:hypothetical protein
MSSSSDAELLASALLVDAHVHLHACFETGTFLEAAAGHFAAAARDLDALPAPPGCLLLAECEGVDAFERLARGDASERPAGWRFEETAEPESLLLYGAGHAPPLVLVAGRQLVTAEGLEVLALGCRERVADGMPLPRAVAWAHERGALAVLPWAFGKWALRRGRVLRAFLASPEARGVLLADNGCRPALLPPSRLLRRESGPGAVLAGSDPLPLTSHARRAGSFGFLVRGPIRSKAPAASLKALLEAGCDVQRYGRPSPTGRFVADLVALRRRRKDAAP